VFAFLALAAIAKFSSDGDYPSKNKNHRRGVRRTASGIFVFLKG